MPRGGRDPFLDNAKLILVTLVVVGHSWTLADENYWTDRIYNWMYLWHLSVFVMVTGYLSRSFTFSRRHLERLVTTVLLPYLVFEGLIAIFRVVVGGERLEELWLDPHWPMWYLIALFLWRLVTPALRSARVAGAPMDRGSGVPSSRGLRTRGSARPASTTASPRGERR